jgi:hypothetical protein
LAFFNALREGVVILDPIVMTRNSNIEDFEFEGSICSVKSLMFQKKDKPS